MTAFSYLTLAISTIIPVIVSILVYFLSKKWNWFKRRNYWIQQLIIGIVFSALAFGAFYYGVEYKTINTLGVPLPVEGNFGVANAIPVITGLIFGGPSGLIVGIIAAISRLFIYPFGVGDFLKYAECLTVLLSGGITWLLRVILFDNKKPKWFYGFVLGLLVEVIHMLLIYTISMVQKGSLYAYGIIRACDIACFVTVSICITLSLVGISIIERDKLVTNIAKDKRISTKIQKWFIFTFVISVIFTFTFTYYGNHVTTMNDVTNDLINHNNDVMAEINRNIDIVNNKIDPETNLVKKEDILDNSPVYNLVRFRRINKEGYLILLDGRTEQVLSLPYNINPEKEEESDEYIGRVFKFRGEEGMPKISDPRFKPNTPYLVKMPDSKDFIYEYYIQYSTYKNETKNQNFIIISLVSRFESRLNMGRTIRLTEYLELLVFIIIFGVIYVFIKKVVISNIHKINNSLDMITNGNLNVKVEVRSNQEFSDLSDDINQTVDTLKKFIEEANKRIDNELEYAKKIQQNSLPVIFPSTSKYDLYASMYTAKQVGGDFYDFFPVDNKNLLILIADVSGKGIPAAMFMMRAKTLIKSLVQTNELTLDHIISGVNDELNEDNEAGMFVTCWCGILNIDNGLLEFVNCGHNSPLIRSKNKYSYLTMEKNCVLGVMPGINYKLEKIKLKPNDAIFLYTDGVTEATNVNKELYGENRLLEFLNKINYSSSMQILNDLHDDIDKFQKDAEQADDITMLMVRYKPNK